MNEQQERAKKAEDEDALVLQRRTQTICLLVLTTIALGAALHFLRPVLVPFVLALFISMVITPVMDVLHLRLRLPRWLAIAATISIGVGGLFLLGALVSSSLGEIISNQGRYIDQIASLEVKLKEWLAHLEGRHDWIEAKQVGESLGPFFDKIPSLLGGAIGWIVESGLLLLSRGFLVTVFMMFLITGHRGPQVVDRDSLVFELRSRVLEYLRVKVLVSAITGFLVYVVLRVIGIDLALVFGLASFFLNFIPNIGSAVAVLLPLPVVLLSGSPTIGEDGEVLREAVSATGRVLAIGVPAAIQFTVGSVLEPKWMGSSLDLNPIVILLSLIFWGLLWGPVGMLLSVPITAILKILLARLPYTVPLAKLLADKPQARAQEHTGGSSVAG